MRASAAAALLAVLLMAGCGGGDSDGDVTTGTTTGPGTTTTTPEQRRDSAARTRERPTTPPGRRDRVVQRSVARHLAEVARTRSRGEWAAVDIEAVNVRGQRVEIATSLHGDRAREQAGSICLAARQGLVEPGEVQTPYDVFVTAGGATAAAC